MFICLRLGLVTLRLARLAALKESDAKKIVALSTLRQLGILFYSLSLGNKLVTLVHVLTHAISKAGLFLVIGSVLFMKHSEQDSRILSYKGGLLLFLGGIVFIIRLRGGM